MTDDKAAHWENVYNNKGDQEVSWFEDSPHLSLRLINQAGATSDDAVVDVGGGASRLVDALVANGQAHITVLDLSAAALDRARSRLSGARQVDWVVSDITTWSPPRQFNIWHDRAAFHFLTTPADQQAYSAVLRAALPPGGVAIIGTFALDGPEKCSGLPVARYDAPSLSAVLGEDFSLLSSLLHQHSTPWGAIQRFHFATFRRR
ncbi:class I SAM-dependent methyltransferase [Devosia sp.]|uniref:class I SAM-dependent methyltransferase n=1 Tax=Devosia sp. TaxID=1871048 RepID=UPI0032662F95